MTNEMTKEQRAELRELCNAATPGPWGVDKRDGIARSEWENGEHDNDCLAFDIVTEADKSGESAFLELQGFHKGMIQRSADALFIAASRAVVPALLDALDKAEAENERLDKQIDGLVAARERIANAIPPQFQNHYVEADVENCIKKLVQINGLLSGLIYGDDKAKKIPCHMTAIETADARIATLESAVRDALKWIDNLKAREILLVALEGGAE